MSAKCFDPRLPNLIRSLRKLNFYLLVNMKQLLMSFTPSDDMSMPLEDNIDGATITFESTDTQSKKDVKKFK